MPQSSTLYIGWDVPKDPIAVAYVAKDHDAHVISFGTISTQYTDIDQLTRKLQSKATRLVFVFEADPCSYWRYRSLHKKGYDCWVKAVDWGKTDRHSSACQPYNRYHLSRSVVVRPL